MLQEPIKVSGAPRMPAGRWSAGTGINEALASLTVAGTTFFEADGLGSVTSMSGAAGLTDTYTYNAFGVTTATWPNPNRFRYTGREWDSETGLYYYRARYYDPGSGRFVNEDPIRWRGGSDNFYGYAWNNPARYVDPTGQVIAVRGDVKAWVEARADLMRDPGMANTIHTLETSTVQFEIAADYNIAFAVFDPDTNIINWNPSSAAKCGHNCHVSPSLVLGHELVHALHSLNPKEYRERIRTPEHNFGNAEEMFTILGPENNAAISLHQCLRTNHTQGEYYWVPTPTSK